MRIESKIGMALASLWAVGVGVALAGIADDFKDAAGRDGCQAIPYSSERSSCDSAGRDVDDWCKSSSRKWSCDDLDPTGLKNNISNLSRKIEELKDEVKKLEDQRRGSSKDDEKRDLEGKIKERNELISTHQGKVDGWKKRLDEEKSIAKDRQEIGEKCVGYRQAVQKIFANAKSKVQSESDPEAKKYVSTLVDKYTAGEKGHQEAIDKTNVGIEKCKAVKNS